MDGQDKEKFECLHNSARMSFVDPYSYACRGGDVENPYMKKAAPTQAPVSFKDRACKELKSNWWLWGSIVFAVLLVGSLVVFRESLYDSAKHGLPFLAGDPSSISSHHD